MEKSKISIIADSEIPYVATKKGKVITVSNNRKEVETLAMKNGLNVEELPPEYYCYLYTNKETGETKVFLDEDIASDYTLKLRDFEKLKLVSLNIERK